MSNAVLTLNPESLSNIDQAVGFLLRDYRLERSHSKNQSAIILGFNPSTLFRLELGELKFTKSRLEALASYMKQDVDSILSSAQGLLNQNKINSIKSLQHGVAVNKTLELLADILLNKRYQEVQQLREQLGSGFINHCLYEFKSRMEYLK